jgi:2-keto-4-pentenoate hydratase/2-oxohepta-3-ene-1,7-dioic acid hydratase in catechol pathway
MKLVTFRIQTPLGWFDRAGAVAGDVVLDLNAAYAWYLNQQGDAQPQKVADVLLPNTVLGLLQQGNRAMGQARLMLEFYKMGELGDLANPVLGLNNARLLFAHNEVTLQAPLPRPTSFRDFYAFEEHVANGFARRKEPIPEPWFEIPVYYKGNPNSFIGPNVEAPWPNYTKKLDYELELGCIIGKAGINIPENQAKDYIAGYCIINDVSARDIQRSEMLCRLGPAKAKDFATIIGPWIVTPDEVGDAYDLRMTADINGERWSDGHSGTIHWSFEQMIAHASKDEWLQPGDIFGSGTVGRGCGLELDRWIQPGDTMTLTIDKLGTLTNVVGQPKAALAEMPVAP